MISFLALGLASVLGPTSHQEHAGPGPKAPIAGISGFRSKSRVSSFPDGKDTRALDAYYVFPDRVRWQLLREGAPASERLLYFRSGEGYWIQRAGVAQSIPLEGDELLATMAHMELRRALMLWPDGLTWSGEGALRRAHSPIRPQARDGQQPRVLVLDARLDEQGRPRELEARWELPSGDQRDLELSFRDVTWLDQGGRWWPHTLTLEGPGVHGWHEAFESVDPRLDSLDHFFLPADRKPGQAPAGLETPMAVKLPPVVQLRLLLAEGSSWDAALTTARRLHGEQAALLTGQGIELDGAVAIEIDGSGQPVACLLRLTNASPELPQGWSRLAARDGISLRRNSQGPFSAADLARVGALLPAGAQAGAAYVRLHRRSDGTELAQLVRPFERPR